MKSVLWALGIVVLAAGCGAVPAASRGSADGSPVTMTQTITVTAPAAPPVTVTATVEVPPPPPGTVTVTKTLAYNYAPPNCTCDHSRKLQDCREMFPKDAAICKFGGPNGVDGHWRD